MHKRTLNNVQLGLFVLVGITFLIVALYLIGNNRNLFNKTFQINATFYKVNGLMKGNNVRFSGIDVGTVKRVEIISDSSVMVTMIIENDIQRFIKKTAVASMGTDGLMGNKLVNIENGTVFAESVLGGDTIKALKQIETDKMLRTLDLTNENLLMITSDLKNITQKVNGKNTLWSILMDTVIADNVKQAISGLRTTTKNTAMFTQNLNSLLHDVKDGKGMLGYLTSDTTSVARLESSLVQINEASERAATVTKDLKQVTEKIKRGEGPVGILLSDTVFSHDLSKSMRNIRISSEKLSENMEAMKHNFLFKGYFKDQEKKAREKAGK